MPAIPPLSQARIAVILLSVIITLLLLRNNHISLYQSLNFIWLLSNHPGSRTILLGITAYSIVLFTTGTSAIDIVSIVSVSVVLSKVSSSVILNDSNHSDNISILFPQCWSVLLFIDASTMLLSYFLFISYAINIILYLPTVKPYNVLVAWPLCTLLFARWAWWHFAKCYDLRLWLKLQLRQRLE